MSYKERTVELLAELSELGCYVKPPHVEQCCWAAATFGGVAVVCECLAECECDGAEELLCGACFGDDEDCVSCFGGGYVDCVCVSECRVCGGYRVYRDTSEAAA